MRGAAPAGMRENGGIEFLRRISAMPRSLMLRLFAAAALARAGAAACASSSLTEFRPALEFEHASVTGPAREQWAALSPEERQRMRSQIREHWQNMPPEERQERREEMRERWRQMSPEERRQIRETIRAHRRGDGPDETGSGRGRH